MLIRCALACVSLMAWLPAQASLVMQGSRVIYEEARKEAVVHLQYVGETPVLLQAWLEEVTDLTDQSEHHVPFIVTPAATRIEPGNGQAIRILRTGTGLPQDRESMLFFNTLEVPPAASEQVATGDAFMQFALRGRWKFFYRPKDLPMTVRQAFARLQFSLDAPRLPDGRVQMRIHNPSPYHVTFSTLTVHREDEPEDARPLLEFNHRGPDERMVLPMADLLVPLEWGAITADSGLPGTGLMVEFKVINDAGGHHAGQTRVGG